MKAILTLCLLIAVCAANAGAQTPLALDEVVAAERAFASAAAEKGTNPAFIQYAAPDGVVFDRKLENARAFYGKRPNTASVLSWSPQFWGVSFAGNLGFTTGQWDYRPNGKTDAPTDFGEFATVWKRQPNGEWQFVVDLGIHHAKPDQSQPAAVQTSIALPAMKNANDIATWSSLEANFINSITKNGAVKTYNKMLAENSRMLRQNFLPMVGKKAAGDFLITQNAVMTFKPLKGELSVDMAYAYGEYTTTEKGEQPEKGYFLRVWTREKKGWLIALDVAYPIPPAVK
jgi:ketosteroid isomerase-like protein